MDFKLELNLIPVSDVDRAKAFYAREVRLHAGCRPPAERQPRVVQMTPPGSACRSPLARAFTDARRAPRGPISW